MPSGVRAARAVGDDLFVHRNQVVRGAPAKSKKPTGVRPEVIGQSELALERGRVFGALWVLLDQQLVGLERPANLCFFLEHLSRPKLGCRRRLRKRKILCKPGIRPAGLRPAPARFDRGDLSQSPHRTRFLVSKLRSTTWNHGILLSEEFRKSLGMRREAGDDRQDKGESSGAKRFEEAETHSLPT